jgi:hypothetical protein
LKKDSWKERRGEEQNGKRTALASKYEVRLKKCSRPPLKRRRGRVNAIEMFKLVM